ncbi:MAG: hypothetical protein H6721_02685 [Sandaracinus sp.]|nr:hypothetical protein [Sandaracinus sp.]
MTRERLVPCPSCGAHLRAGDACPFCDGTRVSSLGTRGGLVAASLLALSACASDPEPTTNDDTTGDEIVVTEGDVDGDVEEDTDVSDEGVDARTTDEENQAPVEPPAAAAYGGPPEPVDQPMYGIPD